MITDEDSIGKLQCAVVKSSTAVLICEAKKGEAVAFWEVYIDGIFHGYSNAFQEVGSFLYYTVSPLNRYTVYSSGSPLCIMHPL